MFLPWRKKAAPGDRPPGRRSPCREGRDDAFDDADVAARLPCGASDEQAVDVFLHREITAVAGIDAAAINDVDRLGEVAQRFFLDQGMLAAGEIWIGGNAAFADRPDRLIGDHDAVAIP